MTNFIEELRWRGMIHDMIPGTEEQLLKERTSAYLGIDPTADSLHIGHLVGVMMLRHLQRAGHRPLALIGGATGMIGDPSMKSAERNLLDEETLRHNQESIKKQLAKFLDFDSDAPNAAVLVNNYDWMKDYSFLAFIRDIGKHITVNYMMAKDSVKKRLNGENSAGMSFTEFSYQLLQGYDYLYLYRNYGCRLQMGGSDQWGNITTGTELIRRKEGGEAFALVCPLITKADGGKFGKTESGNVWLDPARTSPYAFYQFWLQVDDADVVRFLKVFTFLEREEIERLEAVTAENPKAREAQRVLAHEVCTWVHGADATAQAEAATSALWGRGDLADIDEATILAATADLASGDVAVGQTTIVDLLVGTGLERGRNAARKTIAGGGAYINNVKVADETAVIGPEHLLAGGVVLVRKGRRNLAVGRAV